MTRQLLIVSAAAAALALAACNQKPAETTADAAMPDANAAATVPTAANEAAAPDFVNQAAQSDMFEIEAAKVALDRSNNADVKAFAQQMIDDHTKSTGDLKAAIAESGQNLVLPVTIPDDLQAKINDLKNAKAEDFDKLYVNGQVDAHQNALNLLKRYAEDGDAPALQTFAVNTGAVVQQHFDKAKALQDAMG